MTTRIINSVPTVGIPIYILNTTHLISKASGVLFIIVCYYYYNFNVGIRYFYLIFIAFDIINKIAKSALTINTFYDLYYYGVFF